MSRLKRVVADYEQPAAVDFVYSNSVGYITKFGKCARGLIWDAMDAGDRGYLILDEPPPEGVDATHYIKKAWDDPQLVERPVFDWGFDKVEIAPREVTTMRDVPFGNVTFRGPVSGGQPHDNTGPVEIGWTVPGEYTVVIDAFPYRTAEYVIKVVKP